MRVDWASVGRMIERVVAEATAGGADALAALRRIVIDELSYRKRPPLPALRRLRRGGPDRLGASGEQPRRPQQLRRRAGRGRLRPTRARFLRPARRLGRADPDASTAGA